MFSDESGSFTEMLLTGNCGVPPPEPKAIHCFLQVPEGIMLIAEKLCFYHHIVLERSALKRVA